MDLEEYDFGDYLYEGRHWIIFLAPDQNNLGTCTVVLKRKEKSLSNLKVEEWIDFSQVVKGLENALKKAFNATMFNWGSLMNSFYLEGAPEPQVHWHFIPRYDHKVEVNGEIFDDPYFGYMRRRPPRRVSKGTKKIIKKSILKFIDPQPW